MIQEMIDKVEKRMQAFVEFLQAFVSELNNLSRDGGAVLVEGKRDTKALMGIGYRGKLFTVSTLERMRSHGGLDGTKFVVILTDLDREGRSLAARYTKRLSRMGIDASLSQRKRLSAASRGTFLHIENLGRFANVDSELGLPAVQPGF